MSQSIHRLSLTSAALLVFSGCSFDDRNTNEGSSVDRNVLTSFADHVAIPTYELLRDRVAAMDILIRDFDEDADDDELQAIKDAWISARQPWEQCEAWLFGPVLTYDRAIDLWPLNQKDLEAVLADTTPITPGLVSELVPSQKGFHTIEFLLWGESGNKAADSFTDREREYLIGISHELTTLTRDLAAEWTVGVNGQPAFRVLFVDAGEDGNGVYPEVRLAAAEMVLAMSGICREVAEVKLAEPLDKQDALLEESQWSHNSLADFIDNIVGARAVYLGRVELTSTGGTGLAAWVRQRDLDLDRRLLAKFDSAVAALEAIPEPFSEAIFEARARPSIEAAQAEISELAHMIDIELLPLVAPSK